MELVQLGTLGHGDAFKMPWRPEGQQYGLCEGSGGLSVRVHVPKGGDSNEWEHTNVAQATMVEPVARDFYNEHIANNGKKRRLNRSDVESPVDFCHRLYSEMNSSRDEMVAAAIEAGVNKSTAMTQYYAWRKKPRF